MVRGIMKTTWIEGRKAEEIITKVNPGAVEYALMSTSFLLGLAIIFGFRLKSMKLKLKFEMNSTHFTALAFVKCILLFSCFIHFVGNNPLDEFRYEFGGALAVLSGAITSFAEFALYLMDATFFKEYKQKPTVRQARYEEANANLVWYIILGSFLFQLIEQFDFEKASEFVVTTIFTIGMILFYN
jgi:hypothetical protein